MPIFYFDVRQDGRLTRDEAGADLVDLRQAVDSALYFARRFLAQHPENDGSYRVFEIRDKSGLVATVPFIGAAEEGEQPNTPEFMIDRAGGRSRGRGPETG